MRPIESATLLQQQEAEDRQNVQHSIWQSQAEGYLTPTPPFLRTYLSPATGAVRLLIKHLCGNLSASLPILQGTDAGDHEVRIQSSGFGFAQHQDLSSC